MGTRNEQQQKQQQTLPSYPEDLVPQASVRHPATPPPSAPSTKANVQIYSFKNDFGQREHVGVIFDGSSAPGPQVSKLLPSNKHHVLQHHQHQAAASRHDRGHHYEPGVAVGHGAAGINGVGAADQVDHHQVQNLANFIPLEKKPEEVKSQEQSFPLGNPFGGPRLKARPEFFPPLQYFFSQDLLCVTVLCQRCQKGGGPGDPIGDSPKHTLSTIISADIIQFSGIFIKHYIDSMDQWSMLSI